MGLLNLANTELAPGFVAEQAALGWMYLYKAGTDRFCQAFTDDTLRVMKATPLRADAEGRFPPIHLAPGLYRIVVMDARGEDVVFEWDNVVIRDKARSGIAYDTSLVGELLDTAPITYERIGAVENIVAPGDTVQVNEGPFFYTVAAPEATNHHITTPRGVKLHARPVNRSYVTPTQFGCRMDGMTDDGDNLAACFRYAHNNSLAVQLCAGTYRINARPTPLWHYDRAQNGALNRMKIRGQGPTLTRFDIRGDLPDFLFKVTGDTSAYGAGHVSWVDFEDFGIAGNGNNVDLFSFVCADRINIRNVQAFNCVGYAIYAREWWDSVVDANFVRCGDRADGSEKAVIDFDYQFADRISESSCNNIDFLSGCQIEAYRYQAMRLGRATRRVKFSGKIHYWIGQTYSQPAVYGNGLTGCRFVNAVTTHVSSDGTPVRSIFIDGSQGYVARRNVIMGCSLGQGVETVGDVGQSVIMGNIFNNGAEPCVILSGGPSNMVHSNVAQGSGPEVIGRTSFNSIPLRVSAVHAGLTEPADGWQDVAMHAYDAARDSILLVESGDYTAMQTFKDPNSGGDIRIGVQGNNVRVQKGGANQGGFDV